ncbi:cytochrome b/b6 domain-containing protein [Deltaproteobacteria bacterium TL4]
MSEHKIMKLYNKRVLPFFIVAFSFFLLTSKAQGQTYDCVGECHKNEVIPPIHKEITCQECHTNVDEKHEDENVTAELVTCASESCHKDRIDEMNYGIHQRLKGQVTDDLPTCVTCHNDHAMTAPSKSKNKVADYCETCHENILLVNSFHFEKFIPAKTCMEDCHESDEIQYEKELATSTHKMFTCMDCHHYVATHLEEHEGEDVPFTQTADCYLCHKKEALEHRDSIHGISLKEGVNEAAQCWNCHGSHNILPVKDENNSVFRTKLAETCGKCHDNPEFVEKFSMSIKQPGKMYAQSVHGKLIEKGKMKLSVAEGEEKEIATCVLCHGVHDIKNRVQPNSKISVYNVPQTCGKCHEKVTEEYQRSIHWIRAKKGVREAPVCNDCHSEHSVEAINTLDKKLEMKKIQEETCLQCHQNPLLAKRYSLSGGEANQYKDSYHGLAVMRGDKDAAMCIDCHNVHEILPQKHPNSSVNPNNVMKTCNGCHPRATPLFSQSYSHQSESKSAQKIEYWVEKSYILLIVTIIGGMFLHNLLIFVFEVQKRRKKEKHVIRLRRLTNNELIQHFFLLTSFIMLVITGFALKFPNAWKWIGMTETIRQNLHRSAAVVMLTLGVYHLYYLIATPRGREMFMHMLPGLNDLKEAVNNILYYLKIRKNKPNFDQFDYTEKAEYWALIWGTVVMGLTGFVLWFPTLVDQRMPLWFIKVCEMVHLYEAILATLAIIIWHFFFVMFHPKEYPMSFTWIDGKTSLEHFKSHHRRQFETIVLEWLEMKSGLREHTDLSPAAKIFLSTLEENGCKPDDILQAELDSDPELKKSVGDHIENKRAEIRKGLV